jgi:hypothetical protein
MYDYQKEVTHKFDGRLGIGELPILDCRFRILPQILRLKTKSQTRAKQRLAKI